MTYTLTVGGLPLEAAQALATRIGDDWRIEALAISIDETNEAQGLWDVVAYVADARSASAAQAIYPGSIEALTGKDWVKSSLQGLPPVTAGCFFLHGSHDRHRRRSGGVSLEIDAGTAFGTGHHGSTLGCLAALDAILKRRRPTAVLDVGCGTGVLAIAAAKAARVKAVASDIDPEAVRVTARNAALNGVKPLIAAVTAAGLNHRRIAGAAPYDLIFANILARPLAALATGISKLLMPGGILILSGLTLDQCRWITAAYRGRGLVFSRIIARGVWATLVLTKPRKRKSARPLGTRRFAA